MYDKTKFQLESMEQIKSDLIEAKNQPYKFKRAFLLNGDPFVQSSKRLINIAKMIKEILPEIETIGMYASISNIISKSDSELIDLRKHGITGLNIGIESGHDEVNKIFNKGFTVEEAKHQLKRLKKANIDFSVNVIFGGGGAKLSNEHIIETSKLINEVQPYLIFVSSLSYKPTTKIGQEIKNGKFLECTVEQIINEEIQLLELLNLENTFFFGQHIANAIPVSGMLPKDRKQIINYLKERKKTIDPVVLKSVPKRGADGQMLLY